MKQIPLILIAILVFSCKSRSLSKDENGWELAQAIKYKNTLDKENRVIEAKETISIYSDGQELGNELYGITYYEYDSLGHRIAERRFDIDKQGNKTLTSEILDSYNEKGMLKSSAQKRYGLLLGSFIKSYDEAGRLKIEASISIKQRPVNSRDAAALAAQGTIAYDTNFLYHVYKEDGTLVMQRRLNNNSEVITTNYYVYNDRELDHTYTVGHNNDTLYRKFYEKENDGTIKETSWYGGPDHTSTLWKKGDKPIKEISLWTGHRSMSKFIYDRHWNLIEERIYY